MSNLTELERRRIKRQQRILNSAESRLNKITECQLEFENVSVSSNGILELAEHYPSFNDPRRIKYEKTKAYQPNVSPIPKEPIKKACDFFWFGLHHLLMIISSTLAVKSQDSTTLIEFMKDPARFLTLNEKSTFPLFWCFIILEIILYGVKLIYPSDYFKKSNQMPVITRYTVNLISLLETLYDDLMTIVFTIGVYFVYLHVYFFKS